MPIRQRNIIPSQNRKKTEISKSRPNKANKKQARFITSRNAAQFRETPVERHLTTLKALHDARSRPGLLTPHPEPAARSLTRRDTPPLPLGFLPGPRLGSQVVQPEPDGVGGRQRRGRRRRRLATDDERGLLLLSPLQLKLRRWEQTGSRSQAAGVALRGERLRSLLPTVRRGSSCPREKRECVPWMRKRDDWRRGRAS